MYLIDLQSVPKPQVGSNAHGSSAGSSALTSARATNNQITPWKITLKPKQSRRKMLFADDEILDFSTLIPETFT